MADEGWDTVTPAEEGATEKDARAAFAAPADKSASQQDVTPTEKPAREREGTADGGGHVCYGAARPAPDTAAAYARYIRRKHATVGVLALIVCGIALFSLSTGTARLPLGNVLAALLRTGDEYAQIVIWNLRMPRVLTALVGGAGLALAGCAFQSTLRNPLASASTLGVSQGAACGASVAIIVLGAGSVGMHEGTALASNPYLVAACAFVGAMASTLAIMGLSSMRDMTVESIVLAGVALSALFTGATAIIQYFAEDSQVAAVIFWTFGDLGRASYAEVALMVAVSAVAGALFFRNRWAFNAIESGEVSAHGLGVNVRAVRLGCLFVATACAACIIAFCGIINFVGLVAPHVMRRFVGSDYRYLLPASALAGAGLLLMSDLVARAVVDPLILPISAVTSFIGAPMFIYLLLKGARR